MFLGKMGREKEKPVVLGANLLQHLSRTSENKCTPPPPPPILKGHKLSLPKVYSVLYQNSESNMGFLQFKLKVRLYQPGLNKSTRESLRCNWQAVGMCGI